MKSKLIILALMLAAASAFCKPPEPPPSIEPPKHFVWPYAVDGVLVQKGTNWFLISKQTRYVLEIHVSPNLKVIDRQAQSATGNRK